MIGDGMGFNHIEAARWFRATRDNFDGGTYAMPTTMLSYDTGLLYMETLPFHGSVVTADLNTLRGDRAYPDSASSGTALASGNKVNRGWLGQNENSFYASIMELARDAGMRTGLINDGTSWDATTAAFAGVNNASRSNGYSNLSQILSGGFDVRFSGRVDGGNNYMGSVTYANIRTYAENLNYTVFDSPLINDVDTRLNEIDAYIAANPGSSILATIRGMGGRNMNNISHHGHAQARLTRAAINMLDNHPDNNNGFFLMVENDYIDNFSHDNYLYGALNQLIRFDWAVQEAMNFARECGNTIVIVTADHECGDFRFPNNAQRLTNRDQLRLNEFGRDQMPPEGQNPHQHRHPFYNFYNHTNVDIPIFAYGPTEKIQQLLFRDIRNYGYVDGRRSVDDTRAIDLTRIPKFLAAELGFQLDHDVRAEEAANIEHIILTQTGGLRTAMQGVTNPRVKISSHWGIGLNQADIDFINSSNISYLDLRDTQFDGGVRVNVSVPNNAFMGNSDLRTVFLPSNVIEVGENAFRNTFIKDIVFPYPIVNDNLYTWHFRQRDFTYRQIPYGTYRAVYNLPFRIGESSFENTPNLRWVKLPYTIREVGANAFHNSSLEHVVIRRIPTVSAPITAGINAFGSNVTILARNVAALSAAQGFASYTINHLTHDIRTPERFANIAQFGSHQIMYHGSGQQRVNFGVRGQNVRLFTTGVTGVNSWMGTGAQANVAYHINPSIVDMSNADVPVISGWNRVNSNLREFIASPSIHMAAHPSSAVYTNANRFLANTFNTAPLEELVFVGMTPFNMGTNVFNSARPYPRIFVPYAARAAFVAHAHWGGLTNYIQEWNINDLTDVEENILALDFSNLQTVQVQSIRNDFSKLPRFLQREIAPRLLLALEKAERQLGEILPNPVTDITIQGERNLLVRPNHAAIPLTVSVQPANADIHTIVWSSSNESAATVSSVGVVTIQGVGTAIINASIQGNPAIQDHITITVQNVVSAIQIQGGNRNLITGETLPLTFERIPIDAQNPVVSWTSSNTAVAAVSANGVVTAREEGEARITVSTVIFFEPILHYIYITVRDPVPAASITIYGGNREVLVGSDPIQLIVETYPTPNDSTILFQTSNENVATVNSSGLITVHGAGTARITASIQGDFATQDHIYITVAEQTTLITPTIQITGGVSQVQLGSDVFQLGAAVTPSGQTIVWTSSDTTVLTVFNGLVTVIGVGTAQITATIEGTTISSTITITVIEPLPINGGCKSLSVASYSVIAFSVLIFSGVLILSLSKRRRKKHR